MLPKTLVISSGDHLERQLTVAPHGHILTNSGVWTHDGEWIVYDVRADPAGSRFDGSRIEAVHVESGEVRVLYESSHDACCGVVTCSPTDDRLVFIHGPEFPSPDWSYSACHRRGVIIDFRKPHHAITVDACQLEPPLVPGALRGGSHVHTFSGDGQWIAFTYEDHLLTQPGSHALNQRNVGVSIPDRPVRVSKSHPRNHDGSHFSVLVSRTSDEPRKGSDDITKAFEDGWVGTHGYRRRDSTISRAIAFQGMLGNGIVEVFIVDLPNDLTVEGDGPLQGTMTTRPTPPRGCVQRRLTYTESRRFPGVQGPRHWIRSAPDGSQIAFLMRDDQGVVQLWTISPMGGEPIAITDNGSDIASAFSWSPDGKWITYLMEGCVCITDTASGITRSLTTFGEYSPRPEACVFSPDGKQIAFVRPCPYGSESWNQVCVVSLEC